MVHDGIGKICIPSGYLMVHGGIGNIRIPSRCPLSTSPQEKVNLSETCSHSPRAPHISTMFQNILQFTYVQNWLQCYDNNVVSQ